MPLSASAGTATTPSSIPNAKTSATQDTLMLRVPERCSSLFTAIRRASTRWEPNVPRPHPAVESRNTSPMALSDSPVSGFQKPSPVVPSPLNGSSAITISSTGRITNPPSIIRDWNTSVRETGRKPPMKVYVVMAIRVITTPVKWNSSWVRSKTTSSILAPEIRPELT